MADTVDADELTNRLYTSAPEDFIEVRGAGVRELKAAGQTEQAADFAKLTKPSVSAWAVNLLATQRADLVDEVVKRGDELRAAHTGGAGAKAIRSAQQTRQEQIREATEAAAGLAGRQLSESHRVEVASTLEAAASDAAAASEVRAGRLVRPLEAPTGFGALGGLTVITGGKSASGRGAGRSSRETSSEPDEQAKSARLAMLRADAEAALGDAESAAAATAELGDRVAALETKRDQLSDELERVDKELSAARRQLREAERAALDAARKATRAASKAEHAES